MFLNETIETLLNKEFSNLTAGELMNELLRYLAHADHRVNVRMQNGHLRVHRVFDPLHPSTPRQIVELPRSGDESLPIYALDDFAWLEGFARDLREHADSLGLPWEAAMVVLKRFRGEKSIETDRRHSAPDKAGAKLKRATLTVSEVCETFHISRSTLYCWLNEGRLERCDLGKKPGRRSKVLIRASSVAKLLKQSFE